MPRIYIAFIIIVLSIIVGAIFAKNRDKKKSNMTPLTGAAFGFIFSGIIFTDNHAFSSSMLVTGGVLAIIDIIIKRRKKKEIVSDSDHHDQEQQD